MLPISAITTDEPIRSPSPGARQRDDAAATNDGEIRSEDFGLTVTKSERDTQLTVAQGTGGARRAAQNLTRR